MKITLHRPHQIGGCITEIESNAGTKIFIDLGHLLPDGDKPSDDKLASKDAIDKLTAGIQEFWKYFHFHCFPPRRARPLSGISLKYAKLS